MAGTRTKGEQLMDWWEQCDPAKQAEGELVDRLIEGRLLAQARTYSEADRAIRSDGYGDPGKILLALESIPSPRMVLEDCTIGSRTVYHFVWDMGYANVTSRKNGDLHVSAIGDSPTCNQIAKLCNEHIHKRPSEEGTVFAVVRTQCGLGLHRVGTVQAPFLSMNYSKATVQSYRHVVECLSSPDPCGRLILFEGPPGTGKSYMIRALAGEVEATFVLVGASLVGEISGPEVLPVLLEAKGHASDNERRPVVLILEDADAALVRREQGDLCRISDVLNLGDGLLGELIDVRIVATSNAKHIALDPAVTRPGRMCRHVHIDALGAAAATALLDDLIGETTHAFTAPATLADVYRTARRDGWAPPRRDTAFRPGDYR